MTMSQPRLVAIAAMDENRVIGKDNQLPWRLPADLQHFKALTTGHPILMGRKTYESIGRPLPHRLNIVMTRDQNYSAAGCEVVTSVAAALTLATQQQSKEIFIIGGAEIYQQLLPEIERIYLTIVHHQFAGDVFFPALDQEEWRETVRERHEPDTQNAYAYSFLTLDRKSLSNRI